VIRRHPEESEEGYYQTTARLANAVAGNIFAVRRCAHLKTRRRRCLRAVAKMNGDSDQLEE